VGTDEQQTGDYAAINGDLSGLPAAAPAALPAATHLGWAQPHHGITTRTHLLLPIIAESLEV